MTHTKDKLAEALRKVDLDGMAALAEQGYYHDYLSPLDTPTVALVNQLAEQVKNANSMGQTERALLIYDLRQCVMNGEYDASPDESDEWAQSLEEEIHKRVHRDDQIQPEVREQMRALAIAIDGALNKGEANKKWGFFVGMFPFGEGDDHRFNYISNAERKDIILLLKEMIARFEGQPEVGGKA